MKHILFAAAGALMVAGPAAHAQTMGATQASGPIDPARLAIANRVVAKLLPKGIYSEVLGKSINSMVDSMMGSMGKLPMREVIRVTGISEKDAESLGEGTVEQVMEIYDPHWQERTQATTHALADAMSDMMGSLEPRIRDALGRAYAREFSLAELQEIDRFFATPTGDRYAGKSMVLFADPEMTRAMTEALPEIMKQMPAMIGKAMEATKDLPKPRTNKDLTPEERKRVAALLGIDPKTLEKDSGGSNQQ